MWTLPNWPHMSAQVEEVNCPPLSLVIFAGAPKRATQPIVKASTQDCALMLLRGMASGHLEVLSRMVNM
jgi:hypothetical protein